MHIAKAAGAGIAEDYNDNKPGIALEPTSDMDNFLLNQSHSSRCIVNTSSCSLLRHIIIVDVVLVLKCQWQRVDQPLHTRLAASGAAFLSPFLLLENKPFLAVQISTLFKNLYNSEFINYS